LSSSPFSELQIIQVNAAGKEKEGFMKRLIQSEKSKAFITIIATISCLALSPIARAVVPPPDGGYPNFTTAEGQNALFSLTTGAANTAVGWFSLKSVTAGSFNTSVGAGTLVLNTGDANTATGTAALLLNTSGQRNTANGTAALVNNSTGEDNTAVGAFALNSNTATGNSAIGSNALLNNTTGGTLGNIQGLDFGPNVAVGWQALESNTIAGANTAVGYQALQSFTTGPTGFEQLGLCTAVGFQALANATVGLGNNAFGYQTLFNNTDGAGNTAIGLQALFNNTIGGSNVAIGNNALLHNTTGAGNAGNGFGALESNTDGGNNTASGPHALGANTTGNGNTALGAFAGNAVTTANNVICIGTFGENVSDRCYIGNIYSNVQPIVGTDPDSVTIRSSGKLGRGNVSSRRYKHDIKPMDKASETLFALKPVSFRYNKQYDATQTLAFGLIAEEVADINPNLVGRNPEGQPESVRYDQINAMLLNEFLKQHDAFLKEHRKVEKLEATVARQQQGMEALAAQVKEQAGQIQKVSAAIELNKSVARVAEAGQ
jgi:hypothetical protein